MLGGKGRAKAKVDQGGEKGKPLKAGGVEIEGSPKKEPKKCKSGRGQEGKTGKNRVKVEKKADKQITDPK